MLTYGKHYHTPIRCARHANIHFSPQIHAWFYTLRKFPSTRHQQEDDSSEWKSTHVSSIFRTRHLTFIS
jgi:hypothetical protein